MHVLRTPEERFENLPGYTFAPHYVDLTRVPGDRSSGSLRVHYLDEGPSDGTVVLLMHGEPSWCYLYRSMIPSLVDAGCRVIAPDLVGFGRSDKPTAVTDHTYARHVAWMCELLHDHLDLTGVTFFGQDWGGLIGLRVVAAAPERIDRVVVSNTGMPDGRSRPSEAFLKWQTFARETPTFPVGAIVAGGCATRLAPAVVAAYDAPYPDETYKAAPRVLPSLVPTSPDDPEAVANQRAWEVLGQFRKPWLCAFSDSDPVTAGGDGQFLRRVPGTTDQPHTTISGAAHFVQEDAGPQLAEVIVRFIERGH